MIFQRKKRKTGSRGALLLELLVVISLIAIILAVSANGFFLSLRSNKVSGERDVAYNLAAEALEAVHAVSEGDWLDIYNLTKGSQHYKTIQSGNVWTLATGDETISLNNISYTRYVTIDNVSRDDTTRHIQTSYSSTYDDPSTQKITATVTWPNGGSVVKYAYAIRYRNMVCDQSAWTTADPGNTVHDCSDANYDSKDAEIDVTGGSLKLQ